VISLAVLEIGLLDNPESDVASACIFVDTALPP